MERFDTAHRTTVFHRTHFGKHNFKVREVPNTISSSMAKIQLQSNTATGVHGKQCIERCTVAPHLVRVCDNQCALVGKVVVDVRDDLNSHVRLAGPRGSNNHRQARLHTGPYRLRLRRCERNVVPAHGTQNT